MRPPHAWFGPGAALRSTGVAGSPATSRPLYWRGEECPAGAPVPARRRRPASGPHGSRRPAGGALALPRRPRRRRRPAPQRRPAGPARKRQDGAAPVVPGRLRRAVGGRRGVDAALYRRPRSPGGRADAETRHRPVAAAQGRRRIRGLGRVALRRPRSAGPHPCVDRPLPQEAAGRAARRSAYARARRRRRSAQRQPAGAGRRAVPAGAGRHARTARSPERHGRFVTGRGWARDCCPSAAWTTQRLEKHWFGRWRTIASRSRRMPWTSSSSTASGIPTSSSCGATNCGSTTRPPAPRASPPTPPPPPGPLSPPAWPTTVRPGIGSCGPLDCSTPRWRSRRSSRPARTRPPPSPRSRAGRDRSRRRSRPLRRARETQPSGLRLAPAGPGVARRVERRHPVADDVRPGARDARRRPARCGLAGGRRTGNGRLKSMDNREQHDRDGAISRTARLAEMIAGDFYNDRFDLSARGGAQGGAWSRMPEVLAVKRVQGLDPAGVSERTVRLFLFPPSGTCCRNSRSANSTRMTYGRGVAPIGQACDHCQLFNVSRGPES